MKYRPWSDSDRDDLANLLNENLDISEIAAKLERTERSVEYELGRAKLRHTIAAKSMNVKADTPMKKTKERKKQITEASVEFLDQRLCKENYDNIWDTIIKFQTELHSVDIEQTEAHLSIDTDKWIGIAFQGDLHLGNMATDYVTLLQHKEMILNTPNLYLVINGDYCNNYISGSHAGGAFEALFPPATQKTLAKNYVEDLEEKILALVAGCHDLWSLKIDDFDITEYLAKHGNAVYLGSGGDLYLTIGNTTYKIRMRHKYRFNSADNPTHTVKKMFEKDGGFDVGVVSHNHISAMEESQKTGLDGNLKRIFLRAGSYKAKDRYSKQLGFMDGSTSVPVVLFNPKTRDKRGFQDLAEGIDYFNYLNEEK